MPEISLNVSRRTLATKGSVNKMRREDKVPGVFYIKGKEAIPITATKNSLHPLVYTSETHIIDLQIDNDKPVNAILKEVQFDPVSEKIIHFDLIGITMGQTIHIQVPISLQGSAVGVKEGGLLQHPMHKIEVECLPRNIPEHITIDVSNLKIGDSIHVRDLQIENAKILTSPDAIIASVVHPRIVVTEQPVEALGEEEKVEPEVIGKGKSVEEEEEE